MFKRLVAGVSGLLLAVALAGCHFQTSNLGGNEELNARAAEAYTQLVERQDDALLADMSPKVDRDEARAQLPMMQGLTPEGPTPVPEVKGSQNYAGTDGRIYSVAQDYPYADRTVHAVTRFIREGEAWKILSFNVNVTMKSQPTAAREPADKLILVEKAA